VLSVLLLTIVLSVLHLLTIVLSVILLTIVLSVLHRLTIVLSVLPFTDSDYPFAIIKLFVTMGTYMKFEDTNGVSKNRKFNLFLI
jgi:hypothetical protein